LEGLGGSARSSLASFSVCSAAGALKPLVGPDGSRGARAGTGMVSPARLAKYEKCGFPLQRYPPHPQVGLPSKLSNHTSSLTIQRLVAEIRPRGTPGFGRALTSGAGALARRGADSETHAVLMERLPRPVAPWAGHQETLPVPQSHLAQARRAGGAAEIPSAPLACQFAPLPRSAWYIRRTGPAGPRHRRSILIMVGGSSAVGQSEKARVPKSSDCHLDARSRSSATDPAISTASSHSAHAVDVSALGASRLRSAAATWA